MSLGLSPNARATSRALPASCVIAAPNFRGDLDERLTEFTTTGNSRKQRGWLRFAGYADAATRKRPAKSPAAQSSWPYRARRLWSLALSRGQRRDEETFRGRPVPLTPEDCGDQDQDEDWHHASPPTSPLQTGTNAP